MLDNLLLNELKIEEMQSIFTIWDARTKSITVFIFFYIQRLEFRTFTTIKDILICFSKGACYNEYAELSDFAKTVNKNIIYGGNKIYNAEEFLLNCF